MITTTEPVKIEWPLQIEIEDIVILTDRDLSMLGEVRHRTVRGRGVVGRLIDESRPARRRHGKVARVRSQHVQEIDAWTTQR